MTFYCKYDIVYNVKGRDKKSQKTFSKKIQKNWKKCLTNSPKYDIVYNVRGTKFKKLIQKNWRKFEKTPWQTKHYMIQYIM